MGFTIAKPTNLPTGSGGFRCRSTHPTLAYDDNGNRLNANTKSGSVIGNYDDQDRLTQYGNAIYTITFNGELRRKNENGQVTEYNYDVLGNLRSVQLPNGNKIEYVIDARNRCIGKKVNGVLTQAFLYQGSLNLGC